MNSDFSPTPREELEAQITALLLGELPEDEAAELRDKIASDADLRKLHTEIGLTIGLVKEAIASPQPEQLAAPEGLKLSEDKREQLLATFKASKAPREPVRIDFRSWGALAAMIVGLLAFAQWMIGSFFIKARTTAQKSPAFDFVREELSDSESPSLNFQTLTKGKEETRNVQAQLEGEADKVGAKDLKKQDFGTQFRMELPNLVQESRPQLAGGPNADSRAYWFDEVTAESQVAAGRTLFDQSGQQGGRAGGAPSISPTAPRPTSLGFGVSGGLPAGQSLVVGEKVLSYDTAGKEAQGLDVIVGFAKVPGQAGVEIAQTAGPEEVTRGYSAQPRQEELIILQDANEGKNSIDKIGRANQPAGPVPSDAMPHNSAGAARGDESSRDRLESASSIQDARKMIERGRLNEAEKSLSSVLAMEPENRAARYYLGVAVEDRPEANANKGEIAMRDQLVPIEKAWSADPSKKLRAESEREELRRSVETQQKVRDSVALRILQEKAHEKIPKGGMVESVDRAEAGKTTKPSLMERIRGFERSATIEAGKNPDVSALMPSSQSASYDPFFLQNEKARIQSPEVLDEVVTKLGLQTNWAAKFGRGDKLQKEQAREKLGSMLTIEQGPNSEFIDVKVKSDNASEAANIANAVADTYLAKRKGAQTEALQRGLQALENELRIQDEKLAQAKALLQRLEEISKDEPLGAKPVANAAVPQPEVAVASNPFSTFSLNVSDVSFKLAAASLEKGVMPEAGSIRSEEFINAFDYRDPAAVSAPVAFTYERARYSFAHDRDLLRFSVKTAATGREAGKPLNLVLLLDSSGSMERSDRVRIIQECLRVLAGQLQPQDKVSVVTFARTPRLWVDGLSGNAAGELATRIGTVSPEGGTNLEEAMRVGYETAARHFATNGVNRVVLLTDGAANLGEVQPESLRKRVEENRKKGIALDCFGVGWEGLNDDLLEQLSRNGDGRYGFVNTPEAATTEFAQQLAGALKVAASDVKVQVEFNPKRATAYRQIGYAKHQLTKEQFRDNTVDAAEIGAAEAGNALYVVQTNPAGEGPIATVRARFKIPGTSDYREHEWTVPYEGAAKGLEESAATIRLAGAASAFSEWLSASPYAGEVTPDRLLTIMQNVPEAFSNDSRPKQLEWMIRQAKSIAGK